MNAEARTFVWDYSPAKAVGKLVHLRLAELADRNCFVTVGLGSLANACGITLETVKHHVKFLLNSGVLIRTGEGRPATYRLVLQPPENPPLNHRNNTPLTTEKLPPKNPDADELVLSLGTKDNKLSLGLDDLATAEPLDDPFHDLAHSLAVFAYEQVPRPVTSGKFPAVFERIHAELEAGTPEKFIRAAILAGGVTWSANGLRTAINRAQRDPGLVRSIRTDHSLSEAAAAVRREHPDWR